MDFNTDRHLGPGQLVILVIPPFHFVICVVLCSTNRFTGFIHSVVDLGFFNQSVFGYG